MTDSDIELLDMLKEYYGICESYRIGFISDNIRDVSVNKIIQALTRWRDAALVAELSKVDPIASHQLAMTVADRIQAIKARNGGDDEIN